MCKDPQRGGSRHLHCSHCTQSAARPPHRYNNDISVETVVRTSLRYVCRGWPPRSATFNGMAKHNMSKNLQCPLRIVAAISCSWPAPIRIDARLTCRRRESPFDPAETPETHHPARRLGEPYPAWRVSLKALDRGDGHFCARSDVLARRVAACCGKAHLFRLQAPASRPCPTCSPVRRWIECCTSY